jgi:hypothetical protein
MALKDRNTLQQLNKNVILIAIYEFYNVIVNDILK